MREAEYIRKRKEGVRLADAGGYDVRKGEMNPAIFGELVGLMVGSGLPMVVWEPFAGHTGRSRTQDYVERVGGLTVLSFDLEPCDPRVRKADSTKEGPGVFVGGVLFHPPYFGSSPLSKEAGELSTMSDEGSYKKALRDSAMLARDCLELGGFVCAVGRHYVKSGKKVDLGLWYLEVFEEMGMSLAEVWKSEPDVALLFENRR